MRRRRAGQAGCRAADVKRAVKKAESVTPRHPRQRRVTRCRCRASDREQRALRSVHVEEGTEVHSRARSPGALPHASTHSGTHPHTHTHGESSRDAMRGEAEGDNPQHTYEVLAGCAPPPLCCGGWPWHAEPRSRGVLALFHWCEAQEGEMRAQKASRRADSPHRPSNAPRPRTWKTTRQDQRAKAVPADKGEEAHQPQLQPARRRVERRGKQAAQRRRVTQKQSKGAQQQHGTHASESRHENLPFHHGC